MTQIIQAKRVARIDLRLPSETKQLVERAADIEGKTLTEFAESVLTERANAVIAQYDRTVLSQRNAAWFLELLDADTIPNDALTRAIDRYQSLVVRQNPDAL